jgi:glycosyltransferase involved in cell wall biosynthesis
MSLEGSLARRSADTARSAAAVPAVTVILAAYNEAGTIAAVVRGVERSTPNLSQVLVVDDGSTDGTAAAARQAGATVIRHPQNRGKGEALRTGWSAATGDVLLFLDADGQDDAEEIPRLLEALEPGVAMAIGSRFVGTLVDGAITPLNRFGNRLLTTLFNRLYGSRISDTQSGFKAVRTDSVDPRKLRARAYEIETEILIQVLRRGGRVVEVPVTRYPRASGATSFLPMYHGLRILRAMLAGKLGAARPAG